MRTFTADAARLFKIHPATISRLLARTLPSATHPVAWMVAVRCKRLSAPETLPSFREALLQFGERDADAVLRGSVGGGQIEGSSDAGGARLSTEEVDRFRGRGSQWSGYCSGWPATFRPAGELRD